MLQRAGSRPEASSVIFTGWCFGCCEAWRFARDSTESLSRVSEEARRGHKQAHNPISQSTIASSPSQSRHQSHPIRPLLTILCILASCALQRRNNNDRELTVILIPIILKPPPVQVLGSTGATASRTRGLAVGGIAESGEVGGREVLYCSCFKR